MKICPSCKRTYRDDTFSFCLDDGSLLTNAYEPQATLPLPAGRDTDPPRTEILPPQWKPVRSNIPAPPTAGYTVRTRQTQSSQKQGSRHWILVTAILGCLTVGLLGVVGYMAWKMNKPATEGSTVGLASAANSNNSVNKNSNVIANLNDNINATASKESASKLNDEKSSQWLNGIWEGRGFQSNTKTTWTIKLTIQNGMYQIQYPSIPCGGRWTLINNNDTTARFQERITEGTSRCVITSNVAVVKMDDSHLSCRYSPTGTRTVIATATLTRRAP